MTVFRIKNEDCTRDQLIEKIHKLRDTIACKEEAIRAVENKYISARTARRKANKRADDAEARLKVVEKSLETAYLASRTVM